MTLEPKYIEQLNRCNPKYLKELKLARERFRSFDKTLAIDVQPKALSDILDRMPAASRNAI